MTDLYRDSFTGAAASFVGRSPDGAGGAYDVDPGFGGGSLANLSVDGAGKIPFGTAPWVAARSAFTRAVGAYTFDLKFIVDPLNDDSTIDVAALDLATDTRILDVNPFFDGDAWVINLNFLDVAGSGDSPPDWIPFTPTGSEQRLTVTTTPESGIVVKLDGTTIYTTAFVPNTNPDAIFVFANGTSSGGVTSLRLYAGAVNDDEAAPDPISATLAQTLEAATLAAVAAVIVSATLAVTTADAFAGTGIVPPEVQRPRLLLYEPLPLRTTRDLGDFAEDAPLAYVFGDLTTARFPLRRLSPTRGHAADHAMEITGAGTGTTPTDSWAATIEADRNGHVCTFVDFLSPVAAADVMWAYGRGMRNGVTGALIENPGDIMEAVSRVAYRRDLFQQAREECVGINLAGRFAAGPLTATTPETSIRASIDVPAQSAGLIWCAGMARRYPAPVSGYVMALDEKQCALRADPTAAVDGTADILRIAYDFCDVTGKPQKSLELTASPQRYGGVVQDLALPMLRSAANAVAVGTPILQRLACERYAVELNIGRIDVRPGQWLTLSLPTWPFSGPDPTVMVLAVSVDHADQSTAADCEWLRTTPMVSVTAHSLALPDTFAGDLEIADANGIATLTVFDDAHRGLQGARVSLDGGEPKTTNDRGQVSFPYTPGHTYQITIEAPARGTVTIFQTLG